MPAPTDSHDATGRAYEAGDVIVQKYQLTRLLGEGGMGAVWLARNQKLDVDVAIKLIRYERANAEASHRLLQEARAAARIGHRSIVRVFDFGETELDDPFIVMEMLTGESFRALLERKGRLPATQAVRTLLPIASALVEAHASGIVHRDLKPENVMLVSNASGAIVPKLLDFGIAQFRRNEDESDVGGGGVAGTLEYMSPEQMGGRDEVDGRADVWALAVMLYEAITGRVPFSGPNQAALVFAAMTEEPTPITDQLAGDARLWGILQGALAKQSAQRPSMSSLGRMLAEWAIDSGIDSDLAGTSLAAHWVEDTKNPFSVLPPPVASDEVGLESVKLPKAAPLPRGMSAPTEAPPAPTEAPPAPTVAPPPKRRSKMWLGAVGVAVVATALAATRGHILPARGSPPPAPSTASKALEPLPATPEPPVETASAPAVTAQAASAEAPPLPSPESSAAPPAAPPARLGPKKPARKGTLPIAKHPNF